MKTFVCFLYIQFGSIGIQYFLFDKTWLIFFGSLWRGIILLINKHAKKDATEKEFKIFTLSSNFEL